MFSRQHQKTRPIFIAVDILFIYLAFQAAYLTRSSLHLERAFFLSTASRTILLLVSLAAWIASGLWLGVYDQVLRGSRQSILLYAARQSLAAVVGVILFEYVQRLDLSRPFLAFFFLYSFSSLVFARLAARIAARRLLGAGSSRRFLLLAGTGPTALRVARLIEHGQPYGLTLLGFLAADEGRIRLDRDYDVHPIGRLQELLRSRVVDEVIFAVGPQELASLEDALLVCEEEGVRTRLHLDFFPHVHARMGLEHLDTEPMLTYSSAPHDDVRLMLKRAQDALLASFALLVLSPLLALIVAAVRLTSPGPAIFRQIRCGLNGRKFTLYKFRTMVADAERRRAEVEHLNVKTTAFKIPNDPRLTPVGRVLRKFSLDELPQLWNIVRGEMSIVGPRPPVPDEVARYERWQRRRLRMRPGLTCLWALAGRDSLEFDDWMRLDLEYIDAWSLLLDWSIILRTIPRVLAGRGAH